MSCVTVHCEWTKNVAKVVGVTSSEDNVLVAANFSYATRVTSESVWVLPECRHCKFNAAALVIQVNLYRLRPAVFSETRMN